MNNEESKSPRPLSVPHSRFSVLGFSFLLAILTVPFAATSTHAQDSKPRILSARVGFPSARESKPNEIGWKTECWAPVYVEVQAGAEAVGGEGAYLIAECEDPEDVATQVRVPVDLQAHEKKRYLTYLRAGTRGEARVLLRTPKGDASFTLPGRPLELQSNVYLTIGGSTPDLVDAVIGMLPKEKQSGDPDTTDSFPRFVSELKDVADLPDQWIGYQGVDLVILNTSDAKFLAAITSKQLGALTGWVSRGGRLVIAMNTRRVKSGENAAGNPETPVDSLFAFSADSVTTISRLPRLEEWSRVSNKRFPAGKFVKFIFLEEMNTETLLEQDGTPLIVRLKARLGSIIYLAFPLDEAPFTQWEGRADFLRAMLARFAPRVLNVHGETQRGADTEDVTTDLQRTLNRFDVRPISFAFVAFLIVAYILLVGPIDYFLLKNVLGRLEWTWVTFPLVVGAASWLALVTADRIKGHERRLNRIDLIDVEIEDRSILEKDKEPRNIQAAKIRGNSFVTLMSPENASYSVAGETSPGFFAEKGRPASMETTTWLGRPETYFGGSGRAASPAWIRTPYRYGENASTLFDVPVPIWGTKSFWASWSRNDDGPAKPSPIRIDLTYHQKQYKGRDVKITGAINNQLPTDLTDAWVLFHSYAYPVGDLPAGKSTDIALEASTGLLYRDWGARPDKQEATPTAQGDYDPTKTVKRILFHERVDNSNVVRNHSLRMLDWSWRLQEEPPSSVRDPRPRDAILYARVKRLHGDADTIQKENQSPVKLRLETQSGFSTQASPLNAKLTQDTFVRVLMPVHPFKSE
ncbi:MAG: hypothetical protein K2X38_09265 [Gemmataceae bacterium]|nr:hypothetical protein [Gemmataceae bacterium]